MKNNQELNRMLANDAKKNPPPKNTRLLVKTQYDEDWIISVLINDPFDDETNIYVSRQNGELMEIEEVEYWIFEPILSSSLKGQTQ